MEKLSAKLSRVSSLVKLRKPSRVIITLSVALAAALAAALCLWLAANGTDRTIAAPFIMQPDGTVTWSGHELIRDDRLYDSTSIQVHDNVLTTRDRTLTMVFINWREAEYGATEHVQVNLDGTWYTIPVNLAENDSILSIPPRIPDKQGRVERTVDISALGGLPPGRYRLDAQYRTQWRIEYVLSVYAYFWIIEPGGERPPESDTEGPARLEDIVFRMEPAAEARRVITDLDTIIVTYAENLSGKWYVTTLGELEMKQGGEWVHVEFQGHNLYLIGEWRGQRMLFYLRQPLQAGEYRMRLNMHRFGDEQDRIAPEYEFTVVAYDEAPEPTWDVSRLRLSGYDAAEQSTDVWITIESPVLNTGNTTLDAVITANQGFAYGTMMHTMIDALDVQIGGIWYSVPFIDLVFYGVQRSVGPDTDIADRSFAYCPVSQAGILPAGQYRLIMDFFRDGDDYRNNEFAMADFTVEETLDWFSWQD